METSFSEVLAMLTCILVLGYQNFGGTFVPEDREEIPRYDLGHPGFESPESKEIYLLSRAFRLTQPPI